MFVDTKLPMPKIKFRAANAQVEQQAIACGLHPALAKIVAARPVSSSIHLTKLLKPRLENLDSPHLLQDIDKAVSRLTKAIINQENIAIETDHDCDGQTSHAIILNTLLHFFNMPQDKIQSFIGHRLEEGYGLSHKLAQRILKAPFKPDLVITADNGSSDADTIQLLADNAIDVIVTDHHQIPAAGIPAAALAVLNPTRADCQYPDKLIAGCMVAWLFMCATRRALIEQKYLPETCPSLKDLLDFVALGTVADCVSMARSHNNRTVVKYGLELINKKNRACWQVFAQNLTGVLRAEDLAFNIGPLLNSDGRLNDALQGVKLLLATEVSLAQALLEQLGEFNLQRKTIQKKLINDGIALAQEQAILGKLGLVIFLKDGHPGVHGIAASRIKDLFGRPTVFLAPKVNDEQTITGSVRGIENFNVAKALKHIDTLAPGLMQSFGGHPAAGGLSFQFSNLEKFTQLFEQAVITQLTPTDVGPAIFADSDLPARWVSKKFIQALASLEPFGREFDAPIFCLSGVLEEFRPMGNGTHARVIINSEAKHITGVWFNFRFDANIAHHFTNGMQVRAVFTLRENTYQGLTRADLNIITLVQEDLGNL